MVAAVTLEAAATLGVISTGDLSGELDTVLFPNDPWEVTISGAGFEKGRKASWSFFLFRELS